MSFTYRSQKVGGFFLFSYFPEAVDIKAKLTKKVLRKSSKVLILGIGRQEKSCENLHFSPRVFQELLWCSQHYSKFYCIFTVIFTTILTYPYKEQSLS